LKEPTKVELLSDSIAIDMARNGLKVLSYAYKEITLQAFNELICNNLVESDEFRESLESDLTYMGTFGLNDPIRDDIFDTVSQIKYGKSRYSS
jgi:magnesium-transporting ATPase (P-type)